MNQDEFESGQHPFAKAARAVFEVMKERPICEGCGKEIDPDCCGCGTSREGHDSMWSGHSFVPMGCDCMREPNRELQQVLADALATSTSEGDK